MNNATNATVALVDEANTALSIVNPLVIKIVIAVLIVFIGFVVGKIAQRFITKLFELSHMDRIVKNRTGLRVQASVVVSSIVAYLIYIVSIVMALIRLEIATTIITTIVIVLLVVLVLFVIFGLNDVFANFTAGIVIRFKGYIKPGDYIRIKDKRIEGYVVNMTALNIRLETKRDEIVFVPNMALFKSEIIKPKNMKSR